ncbi:MAG: M4 family metallopeptidase [Sporichthyaceae bacterium]
MRVRRSWQASVAVFALAAALGVQLGGEPLARAGDTSLGGLADAVVEAERFARAATDAPITLVRDARGLAHLLGASAGHPLARPAHVAADASDEEIARAHLGPLLPLFGPVGVAALRVLPAHPALVNAAGDARIVKFQQLLGPGTVLGGGLTVVLDASGGLRSVTGELTNHPLIGAPGSISAAQARRSALAATRAAHAGDASDQLAPGPATRAYLDPELLGIPQSEGVVAGSMWQVEVSDFAGVRDLVLIDARNGGVALRVDQIAYLRRVACDQANRGTVEAGDCKSRYARIEGKNAAVRDAQARVEVDKAFTYTAAASTFFAKELGIDLTALLGTDTGDGKALRSTVRYCRKTSLCEPTKGTAFNNAFWNGRGMFYGAGWTGADDVVAHELAHGYTERTSRLLYLHQSGAINESMSDLFGEMVDLTDSIDEPGPQPAWVFGEDLPLKTAPLRNLAEPSRTLVPQPDRMSSTTYTSDPFLRDAGGVHHNSGVGNKTGYLIAAGTGSRTFNGQKIGALGISKTATLYNRVQRMLPSGADYADLAAALTQACADLTGSKVRNGGAQITAADCANVARAIAATQLTRQPVAAAAAPEAGFCPTGLRTVSLLAQGFEGKTAGFFANKGWGISEAYARAGRRSVLGISPATLSSTALELRTPVRVPRGVRTFLRFAHAYSLEHSLLKTGLTERYYDGAVVDLREVGGDWASASGLPWTNGPGRTISPQGGTAYTAFGGDSNGYQSSLLELTAAAGRDLQVRWRVAGDMSNVSSGFWYVDEVAVLACGGDLPSEVRKVEFRTGPTGLAVRWLPPVFVGSGVRSYQVSLKGPGLKRAKVVTLRAKKRTAQFKGLKRKSSYVATITARSKAGAGPTTPVQARTR